MTDKITPFELQVGGPEGIINADVPVRWCITPELVTQMAEDGVVDPHILLVTYHSEVGEMTRQLVPVANLMTYARFYRAGTTKILGWIVDGSVGRKELHKQMLGRRWGEWNTTLVNIEGQPIDVPHTYRGTTYPVNVPEDAFGKEPPRWLKWYVNLWHRGPSRGEWDECAFRRRFLISIPKILPVVVWGIFHTLLKVSFGSLLTVIGWRHCVAWRYAWRPFKHPFGLIIRTERRGLLDHNTNPEQGFNLTDPDFWLGNRFFWWRESRYHMLIIGLSTQALNPGIWLPILFIATLASPGYIEALVAMATIMMVIALILIIIDMVIHFTVLGADYRSEIYKWLTGTAIGVPIRAVQRKWRQIDKYLADHDKWPLTVAIVTGLTTMLVVWAITLFWFMFKWLLLVGSVGLVVFYSLTYILNWVDKRAIDLNDPASMRELLCPSDLDNLKATYSAVPFSHRSLRLSYKAFKNRVCKPMQQ